MTNCYFCKKDINSNSFTFGLGVCFCREDCATKLWSRLTPIEKELWKTDIDDDIALTSKTSIGGKIRKTRKGEKIPTIRRYVPPGMSVENFCNLDKMLLGKGVNAKVHKVSLPTGISVAIKSPRGVGELTETEARFSEIASSNGVGSYFYGVIECKNQLNFVFDVWEATLNEFMERMDFDEVRSIANLFLIRTKLMEKAVRMASIGLVHYDSHLNNIMLKVNNENSPIDVTFVDFGGSSMLKSSKEEKEYFVYIVKQLTKGKFKTPSFGMFNEYPIAYLDYVIYQKMIDSSYPARLDQLRQDFRIQSQVVNFYKTYIEYFDQRGVQPNKPIKERLRDLVKTNYSEYVPVERTF